MRTLFRLFTFGGRPSKIKSSDFRTYTVLCFIGFFALCVHIALIPIFFFIGLPEMSYLNYGSVMFWVIGLWATFNGRYSLALKIYSVEVLIHSFFAVYMMGLSIGFQHYLWAIACMALMYKNIPRTFTVLLAFTIIIFFGVLHFAFADVQYVYKYAEYVPIIHFINVMVAGVPLTYTIVVVLHTSAKKEDYLARAAAKDEFTGLYTQTFSHEMLNILLSQADRLNASVCIIKGSIDHFNNIDETYGSELASQLLLDVSSCIKNKIRCSDIAARWDNNEFFIVLSGIGAEGAQIKIECLRQHVYDSIKTGEESNISVSMSFGLAQWKSGECIDHIISQADQALSQSKANGRNQTTRHIEVAQPVNSM